MGKRGTVVADYGQFYVYDARDGLRDPGRAGVADREALGRGLGVARAFMAVYTSRQAGEVPIEVESLAARPAPDVEGWDHVVEASIEVASGTLVFGSWDDGGPTVEVSVPPGPCRVRVRARELDTADDPEGERDAYSFHVWAEAPTPPALLKGWAGYEARIQGMP